MDSEKRFLVTDRFHVDRRSETLVVGGKATPLHHRTYQVLLHLMSHPRELVTKPELFEIIWGTLDISDAVLTTAIKELRQALGDDARAPWAIATVHARGYRLLLRVHCSDTPELPSDVDKSRSGANRLSRIGSIASLAGLAVILVFALFPGLRFMGRQPAIAFPRPLAFDPPPGTDKLTIH